MHISGLTKRSEKQREENIKFLSKKSVGDLKKLEELTQAQQRFVYTQYLKAMKKKSWKKMERLEHESSELNEMERDVHEALRRK